MSSIKLAAFAAMTSLALVPAIAEANSGCWYPNEARAAQLRDLQTKLMVGTLHCRRSTPSVVDHYNDFVSAKRDILEAHNQILKVRFHREEGGDLGESQASYDRYHTDSANYFSASSSDLGASDCRRIVSLSRMAAQMSDQDLLTLADSIVEAPASGACRPSNFSYRDEPFRDARIAGAEQSSPAVAGFAQAAPVSNEVALDPPAFREAAAEPVPVQMADLNPQTAAVVTQAKAEPAAVSSADALKAAVVALQAATAALQAVAAAAPEAAVSVDAAAPGPSLQMVQPAPVVPPQPLRE
jgi:hypothetical protein